MRTIDAIEARLVVGGDFCVCHRGSTDGDDRMNVGQKSGHIKCQFFAV